MENDDARSRPVGNEDGGFAEVIFNIKCFSASELYRWSEFSEFSLFFFLHARDSSLKFSYTPAPADEEKSENFEWINYSDSKTTNDRKVANSFEETTEFLVSFENGIGELLLSQKEANKVYALCEKLVDCIQTLNSVLISNSDNMNASQVCICTALLLLQLRWHSSAFSKPFISIFSKPFHWALSVSTDFVKNKLHKFNTAYKRNNTYENSPLYVSPQDKAIGTRWEMVADKDNINSQPNLMQCSFQYVPIIDTIRSLFLRDDFSRAFHAGSRNNHTCTTGEYSEYCCGNAFKKSELFQAHPESLQIQIATDDFDICNPLSSKASLHKICAIYFVIRNMPRLSNLSNIYLICLCNSNDIRTKHTDFNNLWQIIVKEIQFIEKFGIDINDNLNVKGSLVNLSFDNLGANQSLGFVEGFNANYYCRICELSKEECRTMYKEDVSKKRSRENYEKHMIEIENSTNVDYTQTRGLKRYCALNDLKFFHILENPSVDIMHDLNEGVIPFLLKHLFKYCISERILKEEALKKMIQYHDYGILNRKNVPSQINMDKHNLNQNASQSLCLFRNIPFILHEFREKLQNVWICVESLLQVTQIVYSSKITECDLQTLERSTYEHLNCLRAKLKIKDNLTRKHHFTTHYSGVIRAMGPLKQMSMIRFESKHKTLKNYVKRTNNFRNINKSLAIKHQQIMSRCKNTYDQKISSGKKTKTVNISVLGNITEISDNDVIYEIKWLQYNSFRFRPGLLILHRKLLYEIEKLMIVNDEYYVLCFQYESVNFDTFLNGLKVNKLEPKKFAFNKFDSLEKKILYEKKKLNGDLYVTADTLDLEY